MYKLDKETRPLEPDFDPDHLNWMEELMYELEVRGEMGRSDAQGFQMCRNDATDDCYDRCMSAGETADYLLNQEDAV